jgi:hypothetical protein
LQEDEEEWEVGEATTTAFFVKNKKAQFFLVFLIFLVFLQAP